MKVGKHVQQTPSHHTYAMPVHMHACTHAHMHTRTYNKEVVMNISTPTHVGCIAGVVPTVAPLHRGDNEDIVCHCDSVTTSDR